MDSANRRSGILLDEDYNVYGDHKETDDELSKAALDGITGLIYILNFLYSWTLFFLTSYF